MKREVIFDSLRATPNHAVIIKTKEFGSYGHGIK